ncbi:hypothetical protein EDB81DRAFT_767268 [Dactylonectria macrodidyma]|uniref:Uncharacterized protein n=1 Tax=Dactylonectria macrodidyma TaxID=307937 RepID=A0A9P9DE53_9HYPO|nr:hypothetical protein EDB81DRAFT_767268 [Dactylonectria macrodidyma]
MESKAAPIAHRCSYWYKGKHRLARLLRVGSENIESHPGDQADWSLPALNGDETSSSCEPGPDLNGSSGPESLGMIGAFPPGCGHHPSCSGLKHFIQAAKNHGSEDWIASIDTLIAVYDQVFELFFNPECDFGTPEFDNYYWGDYLLQAQHILFTVETFPLRIANGAPVLSKSAVHDAKCISVGITPPNDFQLTFLPSFALNHSRYQVIQPHGVDIAKTMHTHLGTFNTLSVRFPVFVLFPNAAQGPTSTTSASKNFLSLERQKDFYDQIIIPAVYETIPDPFRQEIPQSYDMVSAKSRSFEEKVGNNRRKSEDQSRALRLQYTLPVQNIALFWHSVVNKANSVVVPTRRVSTVSYFRDPQLLFQAHDLKNTFCRSTLQEALLHFGDTVLKTFHPGHIDIRSCWLDIGCQDHADTFAPQNSAAAGPLTLLWKDRCNRELHDSFCKLVPESPPTATYYQSFPLPDAGSYRSKSKSTKKSNPGHPHPIEPAIIRAKAYNCNKEMFAVMYSDYRLFGSGFLPLLSLSEEMIDEFWSSSHNRQRASVTRISRNSLLRAWEANKRHLRSILQTKPLANYGIRKEVTFRLETILAMWDRGYFNPHLNPHVGQISRRISFASDDSKHCPFWIVPTNDIKALILTQAARFILPLDHFFSQASAQHPVESGSSNKGDLSVRLILSFYTAQLLCRLLIHTLSTEERVSYDNWIWLKKWVVRDRSDIRRIWLERQGLGLEKSITTSGMLSVPVETIDWYNGHISLDVPVIFTFHEVPLQTRLVSQTNVQSLTASSVTVEVLMQQRLQEARRLFDEGQESSGKELAYGLAKLATQEIARAYNLHIFLKLESFWDRLRAKKGRSILPPLSGLKQRMEEAAAQVSRIVTAQTIWEIYAEAWTVYAAIISNEAHSWLPEELPCWMTTRNFVPPKDGWSEYVFRLLFDRSCLPTWNRLYFLQLYRTLKGFWKTIEEHAGSFDDRFRRLVGRCILITFYSCHSQEVDNLDCPWSAVIGHHEICPEIDPETTPCNMTAEDFQVVVDSLHRRWCRIMYQQDKLGEIDPDDRNNLFKRALKHLMRAVGPQWENRNGLPYTLPWILSRSSLESEKDEDPFRVPISASSVRRQYPGRLCRPTIFFPARENIMVLVDVIKDFEDLDPGVLQRLERVEELLDNAHGFFSIQSHFQAREQATALIAQSASWLWHFLTQSDPP